MFGLSRNNSKKTGPNPYGPQGLGSSGHAPVTISHGHLQGNRYQVGISPLAQSHPPEKKRSVESVKSHTSKSRWVILIYIRVFSRYLEIPFSSIQNIRFFIPKFSVVSRGYVVTSGSHIVNPASAVAAALNNHGLNQSGVDEISTAGSEMGSGSNSRKSSDETAIVVSGRKNSVTKAVR